MIPRIELVFHHWTARVFSSLLLSVVVSSAPFTLTACSSSAFAAGSDAKSVQARPSRPKRPLPPERTAVDDLAGKTIKNIDVRGLKRIEKDAVLAKLGSKTGKPLTIETVRVDIQAIFGMGYFDDIAIDATSEGELVNLSFVLRERPVISKIEFEGNEKLGSSDLKDVTKIKEWSILDVNKVKDDVAAIQKHYEDKGFYLAKVSFEVRPVKPDEVELVYKINDYDKVQIKKITFLNNKFFGDEQLKALFRETKEGGALSFISGSGNFKESAFKQDLQMLTLWYLDHGYVKFRYENPVVTVSDDKKYLYVSIYVDEGDQYKMGTIDFGGDLLFPKDELAKDLALTQTQTFGITKRNQDIQKLTEKYQDLGYAFTNVIPKMNIHDDTKLVDMEYDFEKGNLVYYGEINVLGNSKTYDKVIRRELKIHEGELFNGTRMRESRENVERLGYFAPGEVAFNTVTPKGKNDVLNLEITVKERSTGTITLGAGYGTVQKFFFTTQISEINLFGRGQTVSLSAQLASDQKSKSFNLGFTEPYTFDTRWSTGFDLFYVTFPIPNRYDTRKEGFDLRVGYPVFEYTYFYTTYKNEALKISDVAVNAPIPPGDINADQGILSSVVFNLIRDKRNNRFETTDGNYQSLSFETAGLGGDKRFIKFIANNRYYKRLVGDLVFRNSSEFGQMNGIGDRPLPPSEKFFLGGPNSLKGFQIFSVGPSIGYTDSFGNAANLPKGGTVELFSLFEVEYPLIREAGLKWVAFFDIGNAFDGLPAAKDFRLRTDAGFGIRWFSPIGPLRFELGFPLDRKPGESESQFQFFIGPPF